MAKESSGILLYRLKNNELQVFLVHPGGPFFRNKNEGAWTIPKGLVEEDEDLQKTAKRELFEETGIEINSELISLGNTIQKGGKKVHCFASEKELPEDFILQSNTFEIAWPPRAGKTQIFPEVDKADFFSVSEARELINPAQEIFLDGLLEFLKK